MMDDIVHIEGSDYKVGVHGKIFRKGELGDWILSNKTMHELKRAKRRFDKLNKPKVITENHIKLNVKRKVNRKVDLEKQVKKQEQIECSHEFYLGESRSGFKDNRVRLACCKCDKIFKGATAMDIINKQGKKVGVFRNDTTQSKA